MFDRVWISTTEVVLSRRKKLDTRIENNNRSLLLLSKVCGSVRMYAFY